MSSKEIAAKVQDLLTLCLAKAFATSLMPYFGPNWFEDFKKKEESNRFPITRSYQKSIHDCDFQALLKILYYRPEYAKYVLKFYRRSDEISTTSRKTPFQRTLGRLINDYRNDIAAHVSAKKINENMKGESESAFYDYPDAIRDMTSVAKVFEAVKDENGKSYYEQILKAAKRNKPKGLIIGIVAAVAIIAVGAVLYFKPWSSLNGPSSTGQEETISTEAIDNLSDYVMNRDIAQDITDEFFVRLKQAASSADMEQFRNFYDTSIYSEDEISENYQLISDDLERYQYQISTVAFTDDQICALQFFYTEDGKESGTFTWFFAKTEEGWKISAPNSELETRYVEEMQSLFEGVYQKGYCNTDDYQIVFQRPIFAGLSAKLRGLYYDSRGSLIAQIMIFNGTDNDINQVQLDGIKIMNQDTNEDLVTVKSYRNELSEPIKANTVRYIEVDLSAGETQNAAWIAPSLKNGKTDLMERQLSLSFQYDALTE